MECFPQSEMESYPDESEIDPNVGFIFCPTNEEIISILKLRTSHPDEFYVNGILEENVYKYEPETLREVGAIDSGGKWYFLCARNPLNGERFSRSTKTGYWKATGKILPIKPKGTNEVIGTKRTLVFYKRSPGRKEERTNWVMHECSDNNNQDFVVCKIKEKKDKKRCISTKNENKQAKRRCISPKPNNVVQPEPPRTDAIENSYPECHYYSVSNLKNHAIEDTLQVDPLPPQNLNVINSSSVLDQTYFSTLSPALPEQISANDVFQPAPPRGDAIENSYPEWHSNSVSNFNNHAIEYTLQVDPLPPQNLNVLNVSTRLDQTSFSMLSPTLPDQGTSFSRVSSNENEVLNSSFGSECQWEDYLQELMSYLHEFPSEETEHTRGFCGGDISDVSTEMFNACVNAYFGVIPPEHV